MKARAHLFCSLLAAMSLALLFLAPVTPAALPPKGSKPAAVVTNAPVEIPQSVFVMPTNPQEGRDPFFPESTRVYSAAMTTKKPPSAPLLLTLNGINITSEHKLAMINGRTFAEGEEGEISTPNGRVQVRCVQINETSVIVEAGGERRELRPRPGL